MKLDEAGTRGNDPHPPEGAETLGHVDRVAQEDGGRVLVVLLRRLAEELRPDVWPEPWVGGQVDDAAAEPGQVAERPLGARGQALAGQEPQGLDIDALGHDPGQQAHHRPGGPATRRAEDLVTGTTGEVADASTALRARDPGLAAEPVHAGGERGQRRVGLGQLEAGEVGQDEAEEQPRFGVAAGRAGRHGSFQEAGIESGRSGSLPPAVGGQRRVDSEAQVARQGEKPGRDPGEAAGLGEPDVQPGGHVGPFGHGSGRDVEASAREGEGPPHGQLVVRAVGQPGLPPEGAVEHVAVGGRRTGLSSEDQVHAKEMTARACLALTATMRAAHPPATGTAPS